MAHHQRPTHPLTHRIWRRARHHVPFLVYAGLTFVGMGYALMTTIRATA